MIEVLLGFLKAFVVGGAICTIAQLIINKTKLTTGKILVLFLLCGLFLQAVGLYEYLVEFGGAGEKTFTGVKGKIKSVRWTDCDEMLSFTQDGETVTIDCTGYPYGSNLVVRVAEAEIEE